MTEVGNLGRRVVLWVLPACGMMGATMTQALTYQGIPLWRHARILGWTAQIVSAIVVVAAVAFFIYNLASAVEERDIPRGWSFLSREYSTPISESLLPYEERDTFAYAFLVAATNTLTLSLVGVAFATVLGVFIGSAQLAGNWILSRAARVFVEFFRNVPLIVQLFFWYIVLLGLPQVREGFVWLDALFLNNSGLSFPWLKGQEMVWVWGICVLVAAAAALVVNRIALRRELSTGRSSYPVIWAAVTAVLIGAVAWFAVGGAPLVVDVPQPEGRFGHLKGGVSISIELAALLVGLIIYTSSFIAEIVRAGLQSVSRGQGEASRSLGLNTLGTLRYVTFPQALRVIVPPLISQYLNLTKNSSLAIAIGYADLTSVAKTMTQTAPAISIFLIIMAVYLLFSLGYSLVGNLYNRHIQFTGG